MKIGIYTLGCKVNQYETQAMEQELTARGHELVDFESPADAYIINTCSVTAVSDKKSRQMIRRAKKNSPDAVVAACGCYVQTHEEEAKSLGIDLLMGTNDRARFLDRLEEAVKTRETVADIDDALRRRTFEVLPAGGMANRTRAMLKVEDGCVNFCTYCIIPYARGPVRSLPMDKAAEQVRALRSQGYRELVVTGIEISSYGHDLKAGTTPRGIMSPWSCCANILTTPPSPPTSSPAFRRRRRRSSARRSPSLKSAASPPCTSSPIPSAPARRPRRWRRWT